MTIIPEYLIKRLKRIQEQEQVKEKEEVNKKPMKIGIDIGRVIIDGGKGNDTVFFSEDYLLTPEKFLAYSSISVLKAQNHELHIISKCGEEIERKSLHWLEEKGFFELIPQHRIHFVRKRNLKAPMAQALELDIFIDDRIDIINSMKDIVKYPIQFESWQQTNIQLNEIFRKEWGIL